MELTPVYRLAEDHRQIAAVQKATLTTEQFGLVPEPALFGSADWWAAVNDGRIAKRRFEGVLSKVYWGSMGDYPEFELTTDSGEVKRWGRRGDITRYVEGLLAVVVVVEQRLRAAGREPHDVIIAVDIERSDLRSRPFGPGPFQHEGTTELFRPVGEAEAQLIVESGCRAFPPRLPHQPIFYPVTNYEYADQIAREWNTKDAASGYVGWVTRFWVDSTFLAKYDTHQVGGKMHTEYWIPSEDLDELNAHIRGPIEFVAEYNGRTSPAGEP